MSVQEKLTQNCHLALAKLFAFFCGPSQIFANPLFSTKVLLKGMITLIGCNLNVFDCIRAVLTTVFALLR